MSRSRGRASRSSVARGDHGAERRPHGLAAGTAQAASESTLARNDPGIGSAEALANPKCDPTTKRIKYQSYGGAAVREGVEGRCRQRRRDRAGRHRRDDQGRGALRRPSRAAARDQGPLHEPGHGRERAATAPVDSTRDNNEIFKYVVRDVGTRRRVQVREVDGTDEAAQRADAVEVASAEAVRGARRSHPDRHASGGRRRGVRAGARNAGVPLVIGRRRRRPRHASRSYALPAAEFIGKQLKGGKAEYADDEHAGPAAQVRVIYSSNFDIDYFKAAAQEARREARVGGRRTPWRRVT